MNHFSTNRKVRGATKIEIEGIKYDSLLEAHLAMGLKNARIGFEFRPQFILQPGFNFRKEKIRPITMRLDFGLPQFNLLIDAKGFCDEKFPLKLKMLKYHLYQQNASLPEIRLPRTKKECDYLVLELRGRKL
jgi:hypothetical protein